MYNVAGTTMLENIPTRNNTPVVRNVISEYWHLNVTEKGSVKQDSFVMDISQLAPFC